MNTVILFLTLFVLMGLGMPVAIALGLSSLLTIMMVGTDSLASLTIKIYETSEHYTLLAIPFFILAGALMSTGGVARRMVAFAIAAVGHMRGGLAIASVLACTLFAAVSGSSPATVVAVGSIVIAGMVRSGYPKEFAAGVICNAGTLGILIPPSIVMVVYAAVSAVYAVFVACVIYKDISWGHLPEVFLDAGRTTVMLMFIIANALLFAHVLTTERIPQTIAEAILAAGMAPWMFLLVVNIILLVAGNFMEPTGIILILAPIFFPIATHLGIDPIHLGIIMVVNMEIGMITPPVGLNLFVTSGITGMSLVQVVRAALPWLSILLGFLVIITYVPQVSLFLPNLLFN